MSKVFITSDWHFSHNKSFIYEPRGFKNIEEMNREIVRRHNLIVQDDDVVYVLGDCMLNDNEEGIKLMKCLKGQIKIILGNHCTDARKKLYENAGFEVLGFAHRLKYKGYSFYLSHYPTLTDNHDMEMPLKRKVINLAGHIHTQDPFSDWDKGLIFHVDADGHNCTPWLLDDIIEKIKDKIEMEKESK